MARTEDITAGVNNLALSGGGRRRTGNRVLVSNTKFPLFFYVKTAKKYLADHEEVELSALGMAISSVVTVAEILKNHGLAVVKKITTSTVDVKDDPRVRPSQKAKMVIVVSKSDNFAELIAAEAEEESAAAEERILADQEEQS